MQLSESGLKLIEQFEELVLHPYSDVKGIATIGYGTTRYPDGREVTLDDPDITESQADSFLANDSTNAAADVSSMVTSTLNQNQFDALTSFVYNVGSGHFASSTLLKLVNANPADPNITAAFMMWDKVTINGELTTSHGLYNRRTQEATVYFS